jgi:Protein of unknown function (DUF3465)
VRRLVLAFTALLVLACGGDATADDSALHGDIAQHRTGAEVTFDATLLDNPIESGGHERFHVRSGAGDELEVDHNTTLASPVPAHQGDQVVIHGRLYVDPGSAGVHCTHAHTSSGCPDPGWIKLGSQTYE